MLVIALVKRVVQVFLPNQCGWKTFEKSHRSGGNPHRHCRHSRVVILVLPVAQSFALINLDNGDSSLKLVKPPASNFARRAERNQNTGTVVLCIAISLLCCSVSLLLQTFQSLSVTLRSLFRSLT